MTGRFVVHVIAVIGWLFAAAFAYAFLRLFGFFGVGFYGLLVLFICMQVELETNGHSQRDQRLLGVRYPLLFKVLGVGLTIVGFSGFLFLQLD
ncbi:MAG: hypothetical protein JO339_07140 [Alphaproteobacteria bacterium]|nr:hypothetical protein [Alphaproteobacteria bacterium]